LTAVAEITLGPSVHKIDDRVSFLGVLKITGRQKNPVVPDLAEYITVMHGVNNSYTTGSLRTGVKRQAQ